MQRVRDKLRKEIIAVGVGYGLERLAMVRDGIDDIRKVDAMCVA